MVAAFHRKPPACLPPALFWHQTGGCKSGQARMHACTQQLLGAYQAHTPGRPNTMLATIRATTNLDKDLLPTGGRSQGAASDQQPTLFFAFSPRGPLSPFLRQNTSRWHIKGGQRIAGSFASHRWGRAKGVATDMSKRESRSKEKITTAIVARRRVNAALCSPLRRSPRLASHTCQS